MYFFARVHSSLLFPCGYENVPQDTRITLIEECDRILARAPWIPSFNEWYARLNLTSHEPKQLHGHPLTNMQHWHKIKQQPRLVFPLRECLPLDWVKQQHNFPTEFACKTVHDLFSLGKEFAYGMILRQLFDLTGHVMAGVPPPPPRAASINDPYTLAIHSRHTIDSDDGCDVSRELDCVEELVKSQPQDRACSVWVLSDRPCTLSSIHQQVKSEYNCSVHIMDHDSFDPREGGKSYFKEHGPFAGEYCPGWLKNWRGC